VANRAGPRGAADVLSGFQIGGEPEKQKTMLADQKMSPRAEEKMSGLGI